jgi:phage recombination protein Bet
MTTDQAAGAALALRDGQGYWDERQLAALQQLGIKDVTRADLQVFLHYCQRTGLDPFSRQIYMISRNTKDGPKQTIQVGIDGLRVIAQRAAKRDGVRLSYGRPVWYDGDGNEYPVWVRPEPPAAAAVTVYRDRDVFPGIARFKSFAATDREGRLMGLWGTMGDHLIAKCAEAQALRRAFPHDLEGLHISDEGGHTERVPIRHPDDRGPWVDRTPYNDAPQPAIQGPPGDDAEPSAADWKRLEAQWKRLGITDPAEREIYLCKLTNKEPGALIADFTTGNLGDAIEILKGCEDLAALVDLCAVEAS